MRMFRAAGADRPGYPRVAGLLRVLRALVPKEQLAYGHPLPSDGRGAGGEGCRKGHLRLSASFAVNLV